MKENEIMVNRVGSVGVENFERTYIACVWVRYWRRGMAVGGVKYMNLCMK